MSLFEPVQTAQKHVNRCGHHFNSEMCRWTGSETVDRFKTPSEPVHQESLLVCKVLLTRSRNWQLDQYPSPLVRTREPGDELGIRSVGSSTTVPSDADLTKTNSIPELYDLKTNSTPTQHQFNTNSTLCNNNLIPIQDQYHKQTNKQTNNENQPPTNQSIN